MPDGGNLEQLKFLIALEADIDTAGVKSQLQAAINGLRSEVTRKVDGNEITMNLSPQIKLDNFKFVRGGPTGYMTAFNDMKSKLKNEQVSVSIRFSKLDKTELDAFKSSVAGALQGLGAIVNKKSTLTTLTEAYKNLNKANAAIKETVDTLSKVADLPAQGIGEWVTKVGQVVDQYEKIKTIVTQIHQMQGGMAGPPTGNFGGGAGPGGGFDSPASKKGKVQLLDLVRDKSKFEDLESFSREVLYTPGGGSRRRNSEVVRALAEKYTLGGGGGATVARALEERFRQAASSKEFKPVGMSNAALDKLAKDVGLPIEEMGRKAVLATLRSIKHSLVEAKKNAELAAKKQWVTTEQVTAHPVGTAHAVPVTGGKAKPPVSIPKVDAKTDIVYEMLFGPAQVPELAYNLLESKFKSKEHVAAFAPVAEVFKEKDVTPESLMQIGAKTQPILQSAEFRKYAIAKQRAEGLDVKEAAAQVQEVLSQWALIMKVNADIIARNQGLEKQHYKELDVAQLGRQLTPLQIVSGTRDAASAVNAQLSGAGLGNAYNYARSLFGQARTTADDLRAHMLDPGGSTSVVRSGGSYALGKQVVIDTSTAQASAVPAKPLFHEMGHLAGISTDFVPKNLANRSMNVELINEVMTTLTSAKYMGKSPREIGQRTGSGYYQDAGIDPFAVGADAQKVSRELAKMGLSLKDFNPMDSAHVIKFLTALDRILGQLSISSQKGMSGVISALRSGNAQALPAGAQREIQRDIPHISTAAPQISADDLKGMDRQTKQTSDNVSRLTLSFRRLVSYAMSAGLIYNVVNTFRELGRAVIDVDANVQKLNKTLHLNGSELEAVKDEILSVAAEYGTVAESTVAMSEQWAKQGIRGEALSARTRETALLTNVATDIKPEESVKLITAALKQYNMQTSESIKLIDKWVKLSQTQRVDVDDLANGFTKVGVLARNAGYGVDELNALIATTAAVSEESGENVGNAFRSIFSRLTAPNAQVKKAFADVGIDVESYIGDLPSLLQEVTARWDSWNAAQRQSVAIGAAEKRRAAIFFSMMKAMKDADLYQKAVTDSQNAAGSAARANEERMKGLDKQLAQLKASFVSLASSIADTGLLDMFSLLVRGLSAFATAIANLPQPAKLAANLGILGGLGKLAVDRLVIAGGLDLINETRLGGTGVGRGLIGGLETIAGPRVMSKMVAHRKSESRGELGLLEGPEQQFYRPYVPPAIPSVPRAVGAVQCG